jgi:hypothetical protein
MKRVSLLVLVVLLASCSDAMMSPPPPPPPPTSITVSYCAPFTPLWVAFQDGDGAWTRVQPHVNGGSTQFTYAFASNRGAIATVIQGAPRLTSVSVLYGAPEELETVSLNSPRFCGSPLKTLHGTVAGLDANELAVVQSGFISEGIVHQGEAFDLGQVLPGPRDVLATRLTQTHGVSVLSKMILRHGLDLPDGATLPVFDFGAAEAFAPVPANVTLSTVGSDGAFVTVGLVTNNFLNTYFIPPQVTPGLVQPYLAIPEGQLVPGDLQVIRAQTHTDAHDGLIGAALYFRAPADRSLALGPEVLAPTFGTLATTPALRLRARFPEQAEYNREASIMFQEDSTRQVSVSMTAAYAAAIDRSGAGYDLDIPDLSGVSGFNPAWALTPAPSFFWTANRLGGTVGLGVDPVIFDGAVLRAGVRQGVLTP